MGSASNNMISARIKRIKEKYGLTWLRNSMSYHKFSNLGEKFNGELTSKMMRGEFDFNMRNVTAIAI